MQVLAKWEEYATIKEWKKGLKYNSHKNKLSDHTLESIRTWMPLYLEYSQKNPDDLIDEALISKETVRARLSDFCSWLQDVKHKKYNASVNAAYSVIRGFYSHNNINTQKIRTPKLEPTQVQFSDDNLLLFDIVKTTKDGITQENKRIRRDFLKEFFEYLSYRDKIIALCILSSGLDSGDILKIPIASIRYQDPTQTRIFIRDLRNKTGESVNTFFSKEATKLVKNYIKTYRKNSKDSDPIFVVSSKEQKANYQKKFKHPFDQGLDEFEAIPLDAHSLSTNFRDAIVRYNKENIGNMIPIEPGKQSPLRPKRFRKVFNDACDFAGIPVDIKRVFMGKSDPSNKTYEGKSRQDLEIYYRKVEPNLTIFSEPITSSDEDVTKLKEDLKLLKLDKDMQNKKIDGLELKIYQLQYEVGSLRKGARSDQKTLRKANSILHKHQSKIPKLSMKSSDTEYFIEDKGLEKTYSEIFEIDSFSSKLEKTNQEN